MEASWHQNRSKIDVTCETRFFEKSCSPCSGGSIFQDSGVQSGSKNGPKIDRKIECKIQCILASIFERFWWILGAKLGPSWRQVGLKNRWKIDSKRLGRFHIALGTYQEPPERESMIFHWFWEVWGGAHQGLPSPGVDSPTLQIKIFQEEPNTTGLAQA